MDQQRGLGLEGLGDGGAVVVVAVIVFPWAFTLYVSAFDWRLGGEGRWVGFGNDEKLFTDARFGWALVRTLSYTALAVVALDARLGRGAVFRRRFRCAASRAPSSSCR